MRLIDADALGIGRCNPDAFPLDTRAYCAGWNGVIGLIEQAPTIDAVPVVHGRWERGFNLEPICSVCGEYHLYLWSDHKKCNYCPNCGAKMDGENDNV